MGRGMAGGMYWPAEAFVRPMSEASPKNGGMSDIVMPGAEEFVLSAVRELRERVERGDLPLSSWDVDGPRKVPVDAKAGSAATYTTTVGEVEVELRRYWPLKETDSTDSSEWLYGVTLARRGMSLGWMMSDSPNHPVGDLVALVAGMHEVALREQRREGLGDLSI